VKKKKKNKTMFSNFFEKIKAYSRMNPPIWEKLYIYIYGGGVRKYMHIYIYIWTRAVVCALDYEAARG